MLFMVNAIFPHIKTNSTLRNVGPKIAQIGFKAYIETLNISFV